MPATPSDQIFQKTYNSLSGVDIKAVFHNKAVVPLQAISYAIQREKAPVYTMGHPDPRAFSRGKRGIAGTLIFAVFDRHALSATSGGIFSGAKFWADREEIRPSTNTETYGDPGFTAGTGVNPNDVLGEASPGANSSLDFDQEFVGPWYADQIPPFNITLTGANEMGVMMLMRIFGVEILNEGYGISIDDLLSEMQMTYVCRAITPWARIFDDGSRKLAYAG